MRHKYKHDKIKFYIGDVRDRDSLNSAMHNADYVFSAAALKQVPSCEFYPMEALRTNVYGTSNTLDAAILNGVKKVIVLSTDKAVYPINAMGMSKALMEKVMVAKSRNLSEGKTILSGTRYGNVMASRGSVIPLFVDQIKNNKPITLTNPQMTRFMMTLEEAVELVLFAFEKGRQGDFFVQKSPAATIEVLARALIELYDSKSEIKIIGTRHGEKLYETLVNQEDMVKAVEMDNYFRIPADNRDLNYAQFFSEGMPDVSKYEEYHSHNTYRLNVEEMKALLLKLPLIRRDVLGDMSAVQYSD